LKKKAIIVAGCLFLIVFFFISQQTYIFEKLFALLSIRRAGGVNAIHQEAQVIFNDIFPRYKNFFVIEPSREKNLPALEKLSKRLFLMPKDSFHPRYIKLGLRNSPFRVSIAIIEAQHAEHFRATNAFIEISETIYLFRHKHINKVPHLAPEDAGAENISKLKEKRQQKMR
jgi:hypothetical protein